ncbi:MAG: hypothetical protein P8X57_02355 [Cyclobacteriaceae bacterium]
MRKLLIIFALVIGAALIYTLIRQSSNRAAGWNTVLPLSSEKVRYFFSPASGENAFSQVDITHFQIKLKGSLFNSLQTEALDTIPAGNRVLLTLTSWGSFGFSLTGKTVLEDIYMGNQDEAIIELCTRVLKDNPDILLRWNPEMEVPANRFPWQNSPFGYIRAHRHLDSLLNVHAPGTKLIWAPAGYPGTPEFWPGDDVVDFISITLNSKSEEKVDAYPQPSSAGVELKRKLHRLRFFNEPVLVLSRGEMDLPEEETSRIMQERNTHKDLYTSPEAQRINPRDSLLIGLYDPEERLISHSKVDVEHVFTDFESIGDGTFSDGLTETSSRGHALIVTLEPMFPSEPEKDRTVLDKVLAGKYDSLFGNFFDQLSSFKGRIFLRFAHEMEIPIQRYPWQSQDPVKYIDAFRYFMKMARERRPGIIRVWGPAGDRGSLEWYPGDDYVDFISIAIYGLPDKNITDPDKQESFETIYNRKYRRMRFAEKPVFITEFGVKGPEDYQNEWLSRASQVINEKTEIIGINYFNMVDNPDVWGEGMKAPDWSLTKQTWTNFTEAISSGRSG